MLGADAAFGDGQLEAILGAVDDRARTLVVQRTGWGKSLIYFIAAKILRERGLGPALLVSPLLSLMRNQWKPRNGSASAPSASTAKTPMRGPTSSGSFRPTPWTS